VKNLAAEIPEGFSGETFREPSLTSCDHNCPVKQNLKVVVVAAAAAAAAA